MAKVLLTGATGRLGSLVTKALLARGDTVVAVVRPESTGTLPPGVEKIQHDLGVASLPASAFEGVQKVAFLSGLVGDYSYAQLVLANAFAIRHLLANCPPEVEKVAIASSISVYGEYRGQIVDESFAPKAESPYGKSKLMGEAFAREFGGALSISLLRLGMIYGPAFTDGYFQILGKLSAGKMSVIGGGNNRLPLIHQSDAVRAVLLSLDSKSSAPACREYNVVGGGKPTQKELLAAAAIELHVAPPKSSVPAFAAKLGVGVQKFLSQLRLARPPTVSAENIRQLTLDRAYSTERAKAELGFEASVKLADGLKEVVAAYRQTRPSPS